ncbi:MAG TPA: metal ABC transporter ATP-binding protein [Afifellaceae bacterium]|nr:metal ABC transporter ATP-binding protein [Afifellaceae bacterium]
MLTQEPATQDQTTPAPPRIDREGGPLVALAGVGVRRNGHSILSGVDLDVHRGEIVTIIGPNGGGKTTLLNVILGITAPDDGAVSRPADLRIGYVPQRLSIDPTLPLPVRRLMTLTARFGAAEIAAALDLTGVAHLIDADVSTLSGGEFQRVMLARSILGNPDLLVLDEPVQGVDFAGEVALYEMIAAIRDRRGCAILLVSHDLHVVMAATDRVICLNGHVCCAGVPHEVAENPEYVRLFGPRASGAVALYHHHHDHAHTVHGEVVSGQTCSCGKPLAHETLKHPEE